MNDDLYKRLEPILTSVTHSPPCLYRAIFAELAAAGYAVVPRVPTEAMQRAWSVALPWKDGVDPDASTPIPGTGQGDLDFCPEWQIPWYAFDLWRRQEAMIAAAEQEQADG